MPAHLRVGALVVRGDAPQAGVYRVERHVAPHQVRVFHCADGTFLMLPADALLACPPLTPVLGKR